MASPSLSRPRGKQLVSLKKRGTITNARRLRAIFGAVYVCYSP